MITYPTTVSFHVCGSSHYAGRSNHNSIRGDLIVGRQSVNLPPPPQHTIAHSFMALLAGISFVTVHQMTALPIYTHFKEGYI